MQRHFCKAKTVISFLKYKISKFIHNQIFFKYHPFQVVLVSKTYICVHEEKKGKRLLIRPGKGEGWGVGAKDHSGHVR